MRHGLVGLALVCCAACNSSSTSTGDAAVPSPDAPPSAVTTHYAGLWAGPDGETGTLDLTFTNPVAKADRVVDGATISGTLTLSSALGPITLTGTLVTADNVSFSGTATTVLGSFMCTGKLANGSFSGTCTGADGKKRYFDSRELGVAPVARYCGTFNGGQISGAFNLFTSGSYAGAVFWSGPLAGAAVGTISGKNVSLTIASPAGTITGMIDGDELAGTYDVPGVGTGVFSGSKRRCPRAAANPDAGVRDSGGRDLSRRDGGVTADRGPATDARRTDGATLPKDGAVASCPANGKIVPLDLNDYVSYVAATDGYVFWTQKGTELWRATRAGGGAVVFATSSSTTSFFGLAAEKGTVCWIEGHSNPQIPGGLRCKPAAGGNTISVVNNTITPEGLSMNNGYLHWFSRTGRQIFRAQAVASSVFEIKYNLGSDSPSWGGTDTITAVAGNATKIYFAARQAASGKEGVYAIPANAISTGTGNPVAAAEVGVPGLGVRGMATDGRYTYWLRTAQSPNVGMIGVDDAQNVNWGTLNNYIVGSGAITALAADGQCYFTNAQGVHKQAPKQAAATFVAGAAAIAGDSAAWPLAVDDACVYWYGENGGRGIFGKKR
ncbi:MAG: hypothetical protein IT371_27435 [Deltaproteobacteria bacterium]|nr:hypothetical protein [Deltaproteobacteria bacterium]